MRENETEKAAEDSSEIEFRNSDSRKFIMGGVAVLGTEKKIPFRFVTVLYYTPINHIGEVNL